MSEWRMRPRGGDGMLDRSATRRIAVVGVLAASIACGTHHHASTPAFHRAVAPAACTPQSRYGTCTSSPGSGTPLCQSDSECTAGLDGTCAPLNGVCACRYDDCLTDADCPSGYACSCDANRGGAGAGGSATKCVGANCRLDSDCGPGGYCSPSQNLGGPGGCGGFVNGFYCHTPNDECANAADCGSPSLGCLYSLELGHWVCMMVTTCAG